MSFDHILMIGFGGPTKPEEIWPFLQNVTRGIPIPESRLRDVEHHYHEVGGRSPYNEYTLRLFSQLDQHLKKQEIPLPLFLGMRNWHPFMKDVMTEIKQKGLKRGIGLILAPHRSDASYEKYIRTVEEAKTEVQAPEIEYQYLDSWHGHPGFIHAQAEQVRKVLASVSPEKRKSVPLLFSAHSIPLEMASQCAYAQEVEDSSRRVAGKLGMQKWQVAWQSRSGNPRQPWLEPDVVSAIRGLKEKGEDTVILIPIGFLCDNVEVLFDLDIEAKAEAEKLKMRYRRASTVMAHPQFVEMFVELIQRKLEKCRA